MEHSEQPNGLVFWNTWYRSSVAQQFEHLQGLQAQLEYRGVSEVLLCLSEATLGGGVGLVDSLRASGYAVAYRPTSQIKNGQTEGLCFAKRGSFDQDPAFMELSSRRAIANTKTRWLGRTTLAGVSVLSVHASYPMPTRAEREGILRTISESGNKVILGGDCNTLIKKKEFIETIEESAMKKLTCEDTIVTVPINNSLEIGLELDHVFASASMAENAHLRIAPRGPSNHRPLVVTFSC